MDGGDFCWKNYSDKVKKVLQFRLPTYEYDSTHMAFTQAVFLGAMDFLYVVQRFPEQYRITLSTLSGCIPLIIWAGLTVAVKGPRGARATIP